eukprot:740244-Pleurochrysis_carterae.AAC.1
MVQRCKGGQEKHHPQEYVAAMHLGTNYIGQGCRSTTVGRSALVSSVPWVEAQWAFGARELLERLALGVHICSVRAEQLAGKERKKEI